MQQCSDIQYNATDEFDENITINVKKILYILVSNCKLLILVFLTVFILFLSLTFILPKKYTVESALYINKANETNLMEFNPYAIESQMNGNFSLSSANKLADELEIINSPIVMENVIKENEIKYQKLFGIFNTSKTGKYVSPQKFNKKRKNPKIENLKNTNILKITYTSKDPERAYNIVNSIINNYIVLQQSLNTEKSKSDKAIIEEEYKKAKAKLEEKINKSNGLPESAVSGIGGVTAMSAFSTSANSALSTLKGQILSGKRSQIAVSEDAAKTSVLSSKLEWAKIVEKMSKTSTVLVINPPQLPEKYEQTSPKLFTNILLGLVWGFLFSLSSLIFIEARNKKLSYSMLGNNIIYNFKKDMLKLQIDLLSVQDNKVTIICFDDIKSTILETPFNKYPIIEAKISDNFINSVKKYDNFVIFSEIGQTDSLLYKQVKSILSNLNKKIVADVLVKD